MKNRKFWISAISGLLAVLMILSLVLSILPIRGHAAKSSSDIRDEIKELESEQKDIKKQLADLEKKQDKTWDTIEEMVEQKNNIDHQINLLNIEIENSNQQIRYYAQLIAENQQELDAAEAQLQELTEKNRERIRAMEEEGKISYWSVLFRSNSFTDLIDRLNMMREIQAADQRRLQEMATVTETVAQARKLLEEEKAELQTSRVELEAAQKDLEAKRAEADEILAQLNDTRLDLVSTYEKYEDMEAKLSAEIAKMEKEYTEQKKKEEAAAKPPHGGSTAPNPGGWVTPCAYIRLTSPFGWRIHPITKKKSFHNGVDLANNSGTPIYATRSGTVTVATYISTYGYYVQINHGDGFSSLYAHMTHYIVKPGQQVSAGQVIGYMGSTGWSTGPHLHFTIFYNGEAVNPVNYIG